MAIFMNVKELLKSVLVAKITYLVNLVVNINAIIKHKATNLYTIFPKYITGIIIIFLASLCDVRPKALRNDIT